MQGYKNFVPTGQKISYLQGLLKIGFDTLDCGSFVSHKAIPQMGDTKAVIESLDLSYTKTKLLTIVVNQKGALAASNQKKITYLGYPFSISENFQMRNTHKTIEDSFLLLRDLINLCNSNKKKLVVYLSMGFGNPYGDPWSINIINDWINKLIDLGVEIISLSDTIACAKSSIIYKLISKLIPANPLIEFGVHLHSKSDSVYEKLNAAYKGGCRRFDGAMLGFGGCPMAKDELIGNIPTEAIMNFLYVKKINNNINLEKFKISFDEAKRIFI